MNNYEYGTFGKRLSSIMAKRKMTQSELSRATMFTRSTISRWRGGSRVPRGNDLVEIAVALNVSTDYLLGLSDDDGMSKKEC